nr:glycosyltransferase [Methylobacterium sp. Leaf122]
MTYFGSLDFVDKTHIYGWIKKSDSEDSVNIDVFADGTAVAIDVAADIYREDLQKAGIGRGFHGFVVPVIGEVKPDGVLISVRLSGTQDEVLEKVLRDSAPKEVHQTSNRESLLERSQDAQPEAITPIESNWTAPQGVVSSLERSVLTGRCLATVDDLDGEGFALIVQVGGRVVIEGVSQPAIVTEDGKRMAEFVLDLAEMDNLAREHTIETLNDWLALGAPAESPIVVSRRGTLDFFRAEAERVPSAETARQLVDILVGPKAPSLLDKALRFRSALEHCGLWMSPPLSDKEKIAAADDPALLCFDTTYFAETYPSHFKTGSHARDGIEIFRALSADRAMQPNLLFAEPWYRRHRRDIAQAIACGEARSGLDHFLEVGMSSGLSPCEWISLAVDYEAPFGPDAPHPVVEWLLNPVGMVPKEITIRWPDATPSPIAKLTEMRNALRRAVDELSQGSGETVRIPLLSDRLREKILVIINTNTATRNYHITRAIYNDARTLLGGERVAIATYDNLVETCASLDKPILLCIDGQRINSDIIAAASRYCTASALWTFDDPYNLNTHLKFAELFDLVCTNDLSCLPAYGGRGFYLPLAAPSTLLDEETDTAHQAFDVFFCGTAWPNRVVLLNKLMRDRPHLRYKFALTYNASVPALPLMKPSSSYIQSLSFSDFIRYAKRSRITLSLHRNFAGTDVFSTSSNPGPRVFEVAAAGAYQISENGGQGFEALLPSHLLTCYDEYDELLSLIDKALAEPEARAASTQRLRNRVASAHTYRHRLLVLLEELARSAPPESADPVTDTLERPKLLYVVHNTVRQPPFGGLEVHQDILAQNLKKHYEIYFFYSAETAPGIRKSILADCNYQTLEMSNDGVKVGHANLENPELERFFGHCLAKYNFQMVHFFHFINQCPSLAHIARSYGIPYGISFHDFYTACRQFNLLNFVNRYCSNERAKQSDCDICLKKIHKFPEHSQLIRRDYYGDIIGKAATLMFVSSSARDIHQSIYPQTSLAGDSRVHGAPIPNSNWALTRQTEHTDRLTVRPTRFVVLGNFDEHKGATYLLDAIGACKDIDAEFHFHGHAHEKLRERYKVEIGERAIFHGRYKPGEVNVGNYDFSLHLSIWPETYCQTLSEAWAARVVPIVTNIGALGQRVEHGVNGYKVDPARPATLTRLLEAITNDRQRYLALQKNITDDLFLDQAEHMALYDEAYRRVLARSKRTTPRKGSLIPFRGTTMETLQRRRRTPFWNQGKGKHPPSLEVVPNATALSQIGQLRPFQGTIEIVQGVFDLAGNLDMNQTGSDPLIMKNAQTLPVQGWVARPAAGSHLPVAILRTHKGVFLHTLTVAERPDVAEAISVPGARFWGIEGHIRMLSPDEIVTGPAELSLGWLDLDASVAHSCQKFVPILGVLGG